MILFECSGMIGPLDIYAGQTPNHTFFGWERYDSRILEQKILPMDKALSNTLLLKMGPLRENRH